MDQEIVKSIEALGKSWEDFKSTHETLKDEVGKLGKKDGVLEEHIKKATEDVAKLHEEVQKKFDDLSTKLNRVGTEDSNLDNDEVKALRKDAVEFKRLRLMREGQLRSTTEIDAKQATEEYKLYEKSFKAFIRKGTDDREGTKDLSIGTDMDGGFYVRPVWSNRIITKIFETSPIRQYATTESVSGPELKYPVDTDEASCGWVGETQARPATNTPVVQEKSIIAHELYALPKASQSLLEDAGIDVEAWLMGKVAEKFSRTENTAFVVGNGISKPRGLLSYPNGTNWGQVEQYGSGSSGLFTLTGLTKIVGQLKEPYHPNSRWLMNRTSVPQIMLLQDGAGRYVFQPIFAQGYNNAPLLGYPIVYATDVPVASAGSLSAIFGDLKTAYTIVDRIGISMLRDPYLYKPFIGFYTRKRTGGDVLNFEAYKILVLT